MSAGGTSANSPAGPRDGDGTGAGGLVHQGGSMPGWKSKAKTQNLSSPWLLLALTHLASLEPVTKQSV